MAINNTNTLNDTGYADGNVTNAITVQSGVLPAPGPEYDHVLSVFVKVMKDPDAGRNFTEALYRISAETGIHVSELLDSLDITDEMSLTASLAYYLNGLNSPSTLYGVQNAILPNYYAGRNVLS